MARRFDARIVHGGSIFLSFVLHNHLLVSRKRLNLLN